MRSWVEAGQDPSHFWRLTLREIGVILDGAVDRMKSQHDERAWLAWHIEALARTKKLPKLKDLTHGASKGPRRRQTVEEQIAIAEAWTAALTRR
ncbi:hypothetical protein E5S70_07200 [Ensifer adhaerens]|uniref:hypothetical protein n=1 Tax=Ensifer canadensis TaxID=555315 RepID=UPI00148FC611|nr:hypothetical protein [Ensifer canadensis]NOV15873.1 hypothetical protein [Ensifer canadensis]